ncbi:hypothetical protein GGR57DRAFT_468103 [Xylariaceae sp. FL1272]|nr:hypothetical protein GGR57DRAFT_468103 [Xylariaceae sp. FL1272]
MFKGERLQVHLGLHLGLGLLAALVCLVSHYGAGTLPFILLFLFRYVRVLGNLHSYLFLYRVAVAPKDARYRPGNVAVLLQTVGDMDAHFEECVKCIVRQKPYQLIICTTSADGNLERLQAARDMIQRQLKDESEDLLRVPIHCHAIEEPNRRKQFLHSLETPLSLPTTSSGTALPSAKPQSQLRENVLDNKTVTALIMCDDHCYPRPGLIEHVLAPLNIKNNVWVVNVSEQVRRLRQPTWTKDFINYVACVFAARHNFESAAVYARDGGYLDVSGRFVLMRKEFWQDQGTRQDYVTECWGGSEQLLIPDDDAWIGRRCARTGHEVAFQLDEENMLEIDLGNKDWAKLKNQLLRWARTGFRTGWSALYDDEMWRKRPWTAYASNLAGITNLALPLDLLMGWNLWCATGLLAQTWFRLSFLGFWLFTKFLEPSGHWRTVKRDITYAIPGIVFGWYYSVIKIYALLTVYDMGWSGQAFSDESKD